LECSLNRQAFSSCISPVVYDKLNKCNHEFTVRATDAAGKNDRMNSSGLSESDSGETKKERDS
jgi:hypothetical protein